MPTSSTRSHRPADSTRAVPRAETACRCRRCAARARPRPARTAASRSCHSSSVSMPRCRRAPKSLGRGIWVLDDISALRQMKSGTSETQLFAPGEAVRVRRNVGNDTPFPPEVPHALNPPDGAIVYYSLASKPSSAITLEVLDASGSVIRHMTSGPVEPVKEAARPPEPNFWIAPPFQRPAEAGGNRTNWDLRTDAPPAFTHTFEINANPGLTPAAPLGALVPPGRWEEHT